jgi:hypothetical protein
MQDVAVQERTLEEVAAELNMTERALSTKLDIFYGRVIPLIQQQTKDLDERNARIAEYALTEEEPLLIQPSEAELYQAAVVDYENLSDHAVSMGISTEELKARLDCYYKVVGLHIFQKNRHADEMNELVKSLLVGLEAARDSFNNGLDNIERISAMAVAFQANVGGEADERPAE